MALIFAAAVFVSRLMCGVVIRLAPRLGLIDAPGAIKVHKTLTPRAGGFAVFTTYLLLALLTKQNLLTLTAAGAAVVYLGGFYDDHRPANSVRTKLGFQIPGALLATADLFIHSQLSPGLALVCFGFVLCMINSFNLMDNMNGLTAGMSAVLLAAFAAMNFVSVIPVVTLCGALIGFLLLNYPGGRIFLGDQGSQFLGYITSVLALPAMLNVYGPAPSVQTLFICSIFLLIAFLPFILDTTVVTLIRLYNRKPITGGDQNHLSHQLLRRGVHPKLVPVCMLVFQIVCATGSYAWWVTSG